MRGDFVPALAFAVVATLPITIPSMAYPSVGAGEAPGVYGLFLGMEYSEMRGDVDALMLYDAVAAGLSNFREGIALVASIPGGIRLNAIQSAIATLASEMVAGDVFMVYVSSHGGSFPSGSETTANPGDEFVVLGNLLTDDDLTSLLGGMDDIEKWVLLDTCNAGGFWGDNNPNDAGDLEKLANIGLLAAAYEDGEYANAWSDEAGRGYFNLGLIDALSIGANGHLVGDINGNGIPTFEELTSWLMGYADERTSQWAMEWGDGYLWLPQSFSSPDFIGSLGYQPVAIPTPAALVLAGIGASSARWLRRRRTI
ncbi:MAG: hypothetical protein A2Y77_04765 [Planctomycetes bacterium RBG_13_62_9]|nr:MAG: hypothetical protein A2Y77_04765 [Planctomycetes bacterium RBG_13_62_9]